MQCIRLYVSVCVLADAYSYDERAPQNAIVTKHPARLLNDLWLGQYSPGRLTEGCADGPMASCSKALLSASSRITNVLATTIIRASSLIKLLAFSSSLWRIFLLHWGLQKTSWRSRNLVPPSTGCRRQSKSNFPSFNDNNNGHYRLGRIVYFLVVITQRAKSTITIIRRRIRFAFLENGGTLSRFWQINTWLEQSFCDRVR